MKRTVAVSDERAEKLNQLSDVYAHALAILLAASIEHLLDSTPPFALSSQPGSGDAASWMGLRE